MRVYARQAKDTELIEHAIEIKLRAERRGGELLREMADRGERAVRGQVQKSRGETFQPPQLADLGVTKTQSSRWQKLAELDVETFETRLAAAKRGALASTEMTKTERIVEKQQRRKAHDADLAAKQLALPDRRYGVLLADPPWRWEPYSRETGLGRAPDNHYATSCLETIKPFNIASIVADDSVLFLWSTVPMLPQALEVMWSWGFDYKTNFVWVKDRAGTGYWNRNQHELLLVGSRGNIPAPAPGEQWESVINALVGAHSVKPRTVYELIESYFPNLPKIELFARTHRHRWDAWGHEAPLSDGCEEESAAAEASEQETPAGDETAGGKPSATTR